MMCGKVAENVEKKFAKYLELSERIAYLCTRFERKTAPERQKRFLKSFAKIFKKDLEVRKKRFTFAPASDEKLLSERRKKVLKIFLKNLSKRFGSSKKSTYLCTTFRSEKQRGRNRGETAGPDP